jgi:hypothetical protein
MAQNGVQIKPSTEFYNETLFHGYFSLKAYTHFGVCGLRCHHGRGSESCSGAAGSSPESELSVYISSVKNVQIRHLFFLCLEN